MTPTLWFIVGYVVLTDGGVTHDYGIYGTKAACSLERSIMIEQLNADHRVASFFVAECTKFEVAHKS